MGEITSVYWLTTFAGKPMTRRPILYRCYKTDIDHDVEATDCTSSDGEKDRHGLSDDLLYSSISLNDF